MQEFFIVLKEFNRELYDTMSSEGILDIALEKEKEQIIDAYVEGGESILNDSSYMNQDFFGNSPEYYNKIYNQNK